jgi:hypothetical protein
MVLLLTCGAAALQRNWANPIKAQIIVSAGSLLATVLLLCITWLYVLTNQDTLALLEQQWSESRRVHLSFGLTVKDERLVIWVANLGSAHSIISRARIRTPSGALEEFEDHVAVEAGKLEFLPIPESVLSAAHVTGDLDVSLYYSGPASTGSVSDMTLPHAYNVLLVNGAAKSVRLGFHELRPVKCPKCKKSDLIFMRSDGLDSEDEAFQRQRMMEAELERSCPGHSSKWISAPAPDISGHRTT